MTLTPEQDRRDLFRTLATITANPRLTRDQLARDTGLPPTRIWAYTNRLRDMGYITWEPRKRGFIVLVTGAVLQEGSGLQRLATATLTKGVES